MNNKKLRKWLRHIHRDLGYFFVGIITIYGVSGLLLNHEVTAYSTTKHQTVIGLDLDKDELANYWKENHSDIRLKNVIVQPNDFQLYIDGGLGSYQPSNGQLSYETYHRNAIIDFVHRLHYNTIKGWKYVADFFALSLIFFAVSGLFLSKGKKSIRGRGKWILLAGVLVPVIIFFFI
ncbi:MAG: PepSY-associated TM helix domain-containing protein [Carboxylicivirga sp.]|jgi:hypothetical protein|nr:PepSY-associated TM helix domain-containing protein [Carboxylicivirga sp.]